MHSLGILGLVVLLMLLLRGYPGSDGNAREKDAVFHRDSQSVVVHYGGIEPKD